MQENTPPKLPIIGPSQAVWYLSIALFVFVVALSSFFALSSFMTRGSMQEIQLSIGELDNQIRVAGTDKKILIANIIKNNSLRPSLDLRPILAEFRAAAARANVKLNGFSISNDIISTTLVATEGDSGVHPDPAATVIKMMHDYAENKHAFSLDPISSLAGDPTLRTTAIKFHVLPSNNR